MNVRAYIPDDFPMVAEWAKDRGITLHEALMGPRGFIAEDENGPCAIAMVYLLFEVPIAVVDNFITRPGLVGRQGLVAWRNLWSVIISYLGKLTNTDGEPLAYKVVRTYCRADLAPHMKQEGWQVGETTYRQIAQTIS